MQTRESINQELERRHRLAVKAVGGILILTLALMGLGFLEKFPRIPANYSVAQAMWVAIAMIGLGSIALRRTRFSARSLQDTAVLRGMSGLLTNLQNTTIVLASLAASISVMGFVNTMMTNEWMHIRNAGVIAIGILLYSYPSRTSWQRVVEGIERKRIVDETTAKGSVN